MDSPEMVAVPCPECRCSPVEVLKGAHGQAVSVVSTVSGHLGCESLAPAR